MQNHREMEDHLLSFTTAEYLNLERHETSSLEPGNIGFPTAAQHFKLLY